MKKTLFAASLGILLTMTGAAVAQTTYSPFSYPNANGGATFLTGIRGYTDPNSVLITAVYTPAPMMPTSGLIYNGTLAGPQAGTWNTLDASSLNAVAVAPYGPNTLGANSIRVVGSYKLSGSQNDHGFLYQGPVNGSGGAWTNIDVPSSVATGVTDTIAHSNNGNIAVGNFNTSAAVGRAFVYNISSPAWFELQRPGLAAQSITAYGVWYNGGTSYTIAGGFSDVTNDGLSRGYLLDWNSATNAIVPNSFTEYDYNNDASGNFVSHFNGITTDGAGGYYLTGDVAAAATPGVTGGFFAHVGRDVAGNFTSATWSQINYPSHPGFLVGVTSGNSVFENNVIGIYTANGSSVTQGYLATVPEPSVGALLSAAAVVLANFAAFRKRR